MSEIDYKELGKRIRHRRQQLHFTQEELAAKCELSIPHLSHIERGHTKVSLPALASIANAMQCGIDELLCDSLGASREVFEHEIAQTLGDCSETEIRLIADLAKALKESYRKVAGPQRPSW